MKSSGAPGLPKLFQLVVTMMKPLMMKNRGTPKAPTQKLKAQILPIAAQMLVVSMPS